VRILLCGEGPNDIGLPNQWDARKHDYVQVDGWLQPILRQALGGAPAFLVRRRIELQVQPRDPHRRRLPEGHGAKAYLAKRAAATGGYDALVFMVDADSPDARDWQRIVDEIEAGFCLLDEPVRCLCCVPMSASESWRLADPAAWKTATGYDGAGLPNKPEAIWGPRDDPAANHPHRYFSRICEAANVADNRETRVRIAEVIALPTARLRCPQSMEPFLAALVDEDQPGMK
jgi:hypothetical protein